MRIAQIDIRERDRLLVGQVARGRQGQFGVMNRFRYNLKARFDLRGL